MNELYYNESVTSDTDKVSLVETDIIENNEEGSKNTSYSFKEDKDSSIYIGYLSIPNINLKKGFTEKNSKYNTISKNIQILDASDYPDKANGNVIFAAHSGNSSISYFNKLHLLEKGDKVYITYNNINYIYEITNIYEVEKTGKVEIKRNKNKSSVTLITCTRTNKNTQTVYIGELISEE